MAMSKPKRPEPCSFIVFGITGDLSHRLITPSL
jgi:glucose-6-phosphate 1-dehydrogenase